MKQLAKFLSAALIYTAASAAHAQQQGGPGGGPGGDGGPPDPQEMQAMMDKHIQANLDMNDDSWAKIQPLVDKVQELEHAADTHHMMHGPPRRNDDGNGPPDDQPKSAVEMAISDLKKVLSDKSSTDEKIATATVAAEAAEKKAASDLEDARKLLKAAVTARQIAVLVAMGILN